MARGPTAFFAETPIVLVMVVCVSHILAEATVMHRGAIFIGGNAKRLFDISNETIGGPLALPRKSSKKVKKSSKKI